MKSIFMLVLFILSCVSVSHAESSVTEIKVDAFEFGPGEFLSSKRKINTIRAISGTNEKYESMEGVRNVNGNREHIGFMRTDVLPGESVSDAKSRLMAICLNVSDLLKLPENNKGKGENWYNEKKNAVSCLLFKKNE